MTFSAFPYPVSQSAMIGICTASTMLRSTSSCSVKVTKLASGIHFNAAEMPKPLAQMASNPACSISLALSASWAPTALMIPGRWSRARSLVALCIDRIPPQQQFDRRDVGMSVGRLGQAVVESRSEDTAFEEDHTA